ncbi:hypothetical protein CMT25_11320 [Elizabethkingia anophelis]|uniref:hypothetical protein n=1 Tax=Elizabethkingia anophelis TaxID=1117645 RepID=UPI00099A6764|nr:hypothetical protein [Elizabethkingia anophelis]MDV4130731.1 hypothetical protein [Elizabethkingia anophelis]MDV4132514.1 hypothetical protein [Elizabethkingia anophelis]OPC57870.1 hypothetical protein BAY08_03530 [Elizabethkingia anophelis]
MGDLVVNKKNGIIELFNTAPFCTVTKAELSRGILSDDYIDMTVESSEKLDLNLEDRIIVEGRSYFVNLLPQVKKNAEDSFTHEIRFFGASSILRRNILFNRDSQGGKTGFEFPMTAELNAFLYLIINNANEFESNWILGDFPTNTTTKTISFQKENCLAALQRVCQEFNVEFEVEETGGKFVLHIREKIGKLLPFKVEYGMGNGLYDLTRARSNDSEVVTILYGYGSSENIPVKYRGYSPRLRMPIAIGDYITNQAAQELFGKVVGVFDPDIKPEFKGIVSGVGSLTNGLQEISVSNMDFDLKEKESDGKTTKYLIAGTPAKISVTKGNLAGYDFEINDYDHSSKTFKLKQFADDRGQNFPDSTTVFKFAAGDEFTLIDIMMPDQYITNAEQKLYDETVKEYQKVSQNNVKYTLNVDPLFLQDKGEIGIGDLLPIKDADFGIDKASRIISLKKDLLTDTYTSFDVADSYEISLVKEIVNNIKDLQKEIASQKVINRQSYLDGYRRVEDRFSMYFDADGKMDGSHIKADTIDVGMLSSGSKSRWFQLEEVVFTPNLGSDPNSFRATAGRLVHFGIKTSSGAERVWNLSALTVSNLLNQGYYVYAKCDINGDYGTFVITPDRIVFDSQPNYYHFLIGNLYSPSNGFRIFDANYGVSQVNGRQITAGEIASVNRRLIIDLDKGEIIGKVTFTNDSPALEQVQEKIDAVQVGIRNLFLKSKQRMPAGWGTGSVIKTSDGINFQNCTEWVVYGNITSEPLQIGEEYTISIKYRSENTPITDFAWYINQPNNYISFNTPDTVGKWGIVSNTRKIVDNGDVALHLRVPNGTVTIDWIVITKGNKGVTDWTPAPEDLNEEITVAKQNAANAQNTANTAAQNAIDANKKLSDIANDNILTTSEKPDVVKEWQEIDTEYPKLIQQSNSYNVDNSIYRTFYSALSAYLLAIQYDNFTIDTPINGQEFRQKFREYYDGRADLLSRITTATKNYTNQAAGELRNEARLKLLASQYTNGNCLYRDVDFRTGLNGLNAYNNLGNGTVEVFNWAASSVNAPTKSPNIVICRYNGGGASPYLGGFYFGTPTRANAVFVVRFIMRLDAGYQITFHSNQAGDNYSFDWATPVDGTGKWEEYIGVLRCGATGTFSSSMFFAIAGANKVIETYIAYASVFDVTDVDKYLEDRIKQNEQQTALAKAQADNALNTANRVSQLTSFMNTTVDGNVIASGTMLVGDVTGGNAGITGVTDQGSNSVRIFAGANYANKDKAPLNILDNGLIKMHHPNGNKGFELGIVNGKLVFNVYDDVGNKIMEMGSAGIVFANYIPDSWSTFYLGKFNSSSYNPYNLNEVSSFANGNTKQEMINSPGNIDDPEQWIVTIPKSDSEWVNYSQYSAGTSYDSNTYKKYEGIYYKGTLQKPQKPNDYTEKLADGWYYYTVSTHVWKQRGNPNMNGRYEYAFTLFRLSQGQLVETLNYELSGIV